MRKEKKRRHAKTKPDKQQNSKPKSLLENPKIDDATKVVYAIFFDPRATKHNVAWDDIYQMYMGVLEIEDPKYYEVVRDIEHALDYDLRFRAVLLLFKKVIPTVDPNDRGPIALLGLALERAIKKEDFNFLCVFMQLASLHLYQLQKRFENNALSQPGRKANSISEDSSNPYKREEYSIIYPIFMEMRKRNMDFSDGYKNLLVYAIIKHENYFRLTINGHKDENEKKEITRLYSRLKEHQERNEKEKERKDTEEIVSFLLKPDALRKNYYDKYKRFLKTYSEYILVKSIHIAIHTSIFYSVFWEKLAPWSIQECLKPCLQSIKEVLEPSGIIPLSKQSVRQILVYCKDNPKRIQEINKLLSNYKIKTSRKQLMTLVDDGHLIMMNPNNPIDPNQKYHTSESGIQFLNREDLKDD